MPARWLIAVWLALVGTQPIHPALAGQDETMDESHEARARRLYQEAKAKHEENQSNARAGWELGRACYDLADLAEDDARRASLALEGIRACRLIIQKHPRIAPAHYYLALNLGQQARTKTLGALALVGDIERSLLRSIQLDPKFDYAGAHRAVGLLYRDAPGWPISIGSKSKARTHLATALRLFPDYPGNHLALIESMLKWDEKEQAAAKIEAARQVMAAARSKLTGERWELSWEEWEAKWNRIILEIGEDESPD